MRVDLDLPGGNVQVIHQDVDYYTAEVTINSLPVRRRFDNVQVQLTNVAYASVINPKTFNVFVEGPEGIIRELDKDDFFGEIDLSTFEPGEYPKVTPKVVHPKESQFWSNGLLFRSGLKMKKTYNDSTAYQH